MKREYSDRALAAQFLIDGLVLTATTAAHAARHEPERLACLGTFAEGSARPARIARMVRDKALAMAETIAKEADVDDLSAFTMGDLNFDDPEDP